MVGFNLRDAAQLSDPYENYSRIRVWSDGKETVKVISMYYNDEDAPSESRERLQWQRNQAMEHVDFAATGAKVENTQRYVEKGLGGRSYYE